MQITFLKGYPDYVGKRFVFVAYGSGPASYVQVTATGGGDPLVLPVYGAYLDFVGGATSVSRTYTLRPVPVAVGNRPSYRLQWIVVATGLEVAGGVNLSAESAQIGGFGGVY
jgi:hypothetical protein